MKIEIKQEKKKDNMFEISNEKKSLKELKINCNIDSIYISSKVLHLDEKLYGTNKQESIKLQRNNAKYLINLYKKCKNAVKILKKNKRFSGIIYVDNLTKKKNNNDFMIAKMIEISLFTKASKRLFQTLGVASDYLFLENNLNNMCDFQNNICVKHRAVSQSNESFSGCCPGKCKFNNKNICQEKCLACKIFMCNYIIEKGYFFDVHGIAILRHRLTFFERIYILGLLFTSHKTTTFFVRLVRLFEILVLSCFIGFLAIVLCAM